MIKKISIGFTLGFTMIFAAGLLMHTISDALAAPSTGQVTSMWESQHNVKGRVLTVKSKGGERTTNELHGKHYLTPVATCWDYDIVELQKCGCRLFAKSSACCRKGSSQDCELRIGDSKMIDCAPYGKPKFGLSGNAEPGDCKSQRRQSECWKRKDLVFGPGYVIGPCRGSNELQDFPPYFICPNGQKTVQDFLNKKCGRTPEDCGCTLVEECSSEGGLKCYNDWKSGKSGITDAVSSGKPMKEQAAEAATEAAGTAINKLKDLW